jgi:hypothetical protein
MTSKFGPFATAMSAGYTFSQRFAANRAGGAVWVNEWMSGGTNIKKRVTVRIHLSYGSASIYTESACEHEAGVADDENSLLACAA